jgi:hypothetical protein
LNVLKNYVLKAERKFRVGSGQEVLDVAVVAGFVVGNGSRGRKAWRADLDFVVRSRPADVLPSAVRQTGFSGGDLDAAARAGWLDGVGTRERRSKRRTRLDGSCRRRGWKYAGK